MKIALSLLLALGSASWLSAQVVFFSNIEKQSPLVKSLEAASNEHELLSLGDNTLPSLTKYTRKGRAVMGDKDVSVIKKDGLYDFEGIKKKVLCPGPEVEEIDDQHVLIKINSNWVLDLDYRYFAANEDCDIFNHIHMVEELEGVMEDYEDWNKIVVAHHPIVSISELNGKGLAWLNLIPLYGQLRRSYKANAGNAQDMPHPDYQRYVHAMHKVLSQFDKTVFVTGHDRLNTVIEDDLLTHINVNTGQRSYRSHSNDHTLYRSSEPAYLTLDAGGFTFVTVAGSHQLNDVFRSRSEQAVEPIALPASISNTSTASEKYHPTKMNTFWMGSGYRDAWSEPVTAPLLDIDTYDGGLKPYAIGGGLQTMSVKFKSENGKKYAFRVLDKQPEKSLNEVLQNSLYKNITQELITTMHPYAPLVANELLDATDVIHIKPELFVLDKNDRLDPQYYPYIGKIGTLEEKPKGKGKKRKGFYDADEVTTSFEMLLDLRRSPKSKIDKMAYAKARLMDMYIGDWDRHEDNWKWAMYKEDGHHIYKPIPKDRDHTFSHWTGLIPSIADMVIMNAEDFDHKFGNLRQLNFKARYLDRQLAGELSLDDWLSAVAYIQSRMTDEVIERAVSKFPPEVRDMHGAEIAAKLKSRRADLPRAMRAYYAELNKEVQIPSSNKRDLVKVNHLANGDVQVEMFHFKGGKAADQAYYDRTFEHDVVKRIYLFGLDGRDRFDITGSGKSSILVEVVGGKGEDEVVNQATDKTVVFDTRQEDKISGPIRLKRPSKVAHYDPYTFDFNWLIPRATIRRSSGNGWGFGAGFSYLTRGFNKAGFVDRYDFVGLYYPELGAYRLDAKYTRKDAVGRFDYFGASRFSTLFDKFPFFYGIGNDTEVERRDRRRLNRIDYDFWDVYSGLERVFYAKSKWTGGLLYERHNVLNYKDRNVINADLPGYGLDQFAGLRTRVDLDFTDNTAYPMDGSLFFVELEGRSSFDGDLSGNLRSRFAHFKTLDIGPKLTFAGALNFQQAMGDLNFYHLSRLGSQTHFRGYTRNRFIDKYALLYNTELRVNLGSINTPLIRFFVGVFGFYDGGRVWNDSSEFYQGEWNNSYGGGIFVSPGWEQFAITFTLARPEDNFTYSKIQLGFDF